MAKMTRAKFEEQVALAVNAYNVLESSLAFFAHPKMLHYNNGRGTVILEFTIHHGKKTWSVTARIEVTLKRVNMRYEWVVQLFDETNPDSEIHGLVFEGGLHHRVREGILQAISEVVEVYHP